MQGGFYGGIHFSSHDTEERLDLGTVVRLFVVQFAVVLNVFRKFPFLFKFNLVYIYVVYLDLHGLFVVLMATKNK